MKITPPQLHCSASFLRMHGGEYEAPSNDLEDAAKRIEVLESAIELACRELDAAEVWPLHKRLVDLRTALGAALEGA